MAEVRLVEQIGRVQYHEVTLSKTQEERAAELRKEALIVDLHAHPIVLPEDLNQLQEYAATLDYPIGFEGLKYGGVTACFCANIDFKGILSGSAWHWNDTITEVANYSFQISKNHDHAVHACGLEGIERAKREGKTAMFTILETGGDCLEDKPDRLQVLYGIGVRCMGLTYTKRNLLGDGQFERTDAGLSDLGVRVVERMNELGMLIDLSHSSTQTTLDAANTSKEPVVVTHAGMRALYPAPRMKTDEEAQAIAEKGGIFGIIAAPNALSAKSAQGIDDVLDHIDYAVKLVGVEHVGVGTDTLFGDHSGLQRIILSRLGVTRPKGAEYIDYMKGIENPSEWPNIIRGLVSRGYSDSEVKKIVGENAIRLIGRVLS